MSNEEILEKAITKAIDGGWVESKFNETWVWNDKFRVFLYRSMRDDDYDQDEFSLSDILYDHSFAKALWGSRWDEDRGCKVHHTIHALDSMGDDYSEPYEYHLQQMVIAEDPIKYLGENIKQA